MENFNNNQPVIAPPTYWTTIKIAALFGGFIVSIFVLVASSKYFGGYSLLYGVDTALALVLMMALFTMADYVGRCGVSGWFCGIMGVVALYTLWHGVVGVFVPMEYDLNGESKTEDVLEALSGFSDFLEYVFVVLGIIGGALILRKCKGAIEELRYFGWALIVAPFVGVVSGNVIENNLGLLYFLSICSSLAIIITAYLTIEKSRTLTAQEE